MVKSELPELRLEEMLKLGGTLGTCGKGGVGSYMFVVSVYLKETGCYGCGGIT